MSKSPNRAARKKAERAEEKMYTPGQSAPQRGQPVANLAKFGKSQNQKK
jgi:hypothetical protein